MSRKPKSNDSRPNIPAADRRSASLTGRIFRAVFFAAMAVLLVTAIIVMGVMYDYSTGVQKQLLRSELELAAAAVEQQGSTYLSAVRADDYRLTLVAADGTVLQDTQADADTMENHADREEIREALETGRGESARYSSTLTKRTLNQAVRLPDGTVLRISAEQLSLLTVALGMLQPTAVIGLLAVALSAVLAGCMARRIVTPLNELDLEHPLDNAAYEELSPLLRRIDSQHRHINAQLRQLREKTDEFAQITACLNEGLVLLTADGRVLRINPAAARLYAADQSCEGADFLTLDRTPAMSRAIADAARTGRARLRARHGGREYQFDISRIDSDGHMLGTAILAFDVTEQAQAERSRREFTANVSHELKTPLHTIMGSAELIETGMASPEDVPRFAGRIRSEAARLVTLIEDIIRLSQLDENEDAGDTLPREPAALRAVAEDAVQALRQEADRRNVTVRVAGDDGVLTGVRQLLYEIVYNLCDNAIRYNRPGGTVDITVNEQKDAVTLTVADTGIGIPPEHQSRVFERFYRVDKSHSRACGGTGLGLSIVKHAAACHGARISLRSTPDVGTTITVEFPKPGVDSPVKTPE